MRPHVGALVGIAIAGCSSSPAPSVNDTPPYGVDEVEQVMFAHAACISGWFANETAIVGLRGGEIARLMEETGRIVLTREVLDCVIAAGADCDAVRACFGATVDTTGATCTTPTGSCAGDVIMGCEPALTTSSSAYTWTLDCSYIGRTCYQGAAGSVPSCVARTCMTSVAHTCDGVDDVLVCEGTPTARTACRIGTTCAIADHFVGCLGAPCSDSTCVGDTMVFCDGAHGRVSQVLPCASFGQRCDPATRGCVPTHAACDANASPTCAGTSVAYCGPSGEPRTFDCVAHGWGACEVTASHLTRCAPTGVRID